MDGTSIDTRVKIVWGLYILTAVTGLTALAGVIAAYAWRHEGSSDPLQTHLAGAIRVFWWFAGLTAVGLLTSIIGIGFLILFVAGIYVVVMGAIGLVRVFDNKPWI